MEKATIDERIISTFVIILFGIIYNAAQSKSITFLLKSNRRTSSRRPFHLRNTTLASPLYISDNEVFQRVRVLQVLQIGEAPIMGFFLIIIFAFFSSS